MPQTETQAAPAHDSPSVADTGEPFASRIALCRRALAHGLPLALRVSGTSMLPTLWPAQLVRIECASAEQIRVGSVVVYERDCRFVVHRVVARDQSGHFVTRGDALDGDDAPVAPAELVGVVTGVLRGRHVHTLGDRPPPVARAVAWLVRRSLLIRRTLDRLHALRAEVMTTT